MTLAFIALFAPQEDNTAGVHWVGQLLHAIAGLHHTDDLLLFTNDECLASISIKGLQVVPVKRPRFFWNRISQQRQWRRMLQDAKAASVVSFGLQSFVDTGSATHLFITDNDFRSKRVWRHKKYYPKCQSLLAANEAAKQKMLPLSGTAAREIEVLYGGPPFSNLVEVDTTLVKDRFTGGAEYFFYHGCLADHAPIISLLKAFSRFKRRQKSGWKLVLAKAGTTAPPALQEVLQTYKYRADVILLANPGAELVQSLYAAAYCFVYPAAPDYYGFDLLQAISRKLPIIATDACREWTQQAALYFERGDEEKLAAHLMEIYKDEGLHRRLASAAAEHAADFSWTITAHRLLEWLGNR